ncbi:MAG: thiol peroxidase [Candidatus Latescibacteria bacterium]|nr:thiol peroxidase [Candidatus Latescibacterota bacterium]
MAIERPAAVTLRGNPFTLVGPEIKVGDKAPAFQVLGGDLSSVTLDTYKGKVKVICAVPSLDTPVCDTETRRFNAEAANLSDHIAILTVSVDLPFAQKRWCGANGVDKVTALSDHRETAFGQAYGTLIKELRLLSRAVFVVDASDTVRYVEYVPEVASEPNYGAALAAAKAAV